MSRVSASESLRDPHVPGAHRLIVAGVAVCPARSEAALADKRVGVGHEIQGVQMREQRARPLLLVHLSAAVDPHKAPGMGSTTRRFTGEGQQHVSTGGRASDVSE
jgi:hypothetical protein